MPLCAIQNNHDGSYHFFILSTKIGYQFLVHEKVTLSPTVNPYTSHRKGPPLVEELQTAPCSHLAESVINSTLLVPSYQIRSVSNYSCSSKRKVLTVLASVQDNCFLVTAIFVNNFNSSKLFEFDVD